MTCPRCQAENPAGMKFCGQCAAPLTVRCASCGTSNPPDNRFCGQCATPLSSVAASGSTPLPPARVPRHLAERILTSKAALEGERKQVTVLFADLKGSMELLAHRDPEEARNLLDPVLQLMMDAVHRYEGTVNQVMGDGIMALFGAPLAHEDHAVRACLAALDMQAALRAHAGAMGSDRGSLLAIRVGLNSGEVVVRSIGSDLHMDYSAIGETTHLAARMEQAARPGTILLTRDTLHLAQGFIQVAPLGPLAVKGLTETIDGYELTGMLPVRTRVEAGRSRGLSPFVGRERHVEALSHAQESAGKGQGQVVMVVGEAGVGKSRLLSEFAEPVRTTGWLVLQSGALSYGTATSYLLMRALVKSYFNIAGSETTHQVRAKVAQGLAALETPPADAESPLLALLEALAADDPFQSVDPPLRRGRITDAIRYLLVAESLQQPVLLILEDLHWVDPESESVLDALVESLPGSRLLLVMSARPGYQERWTAKTYYQRIRLDPLAADSTDELLGALLGHDASLAAVKEVLTDRTGGNPLFLEETVHSLVETKVLAGAPGAYAASGSLTSIAIPPTVQALLAARIDRLPPAERSLLQIAAVLGMEAPLAILDAVTDAPPAEVREHLLQLNSREFVYEARLIPEPAYRFKHALTREVAYASLLQEQRVSLHRRVAQVVEDRYQDRGPEFLEMLAHHFELGQVRDKAARYYLAVAERARSKYAYTTAISACQRALDLIAPQPDLADQRQRALVLLGDLYGLTGDLNRANESYETALGVSPGGMPHRQISDRLHRARTVSRAGATIAFYEHGHGDDTLLLVNPLTYGLETHQPLIQELCHEFTIITVDPRGTGASDPIPVVYTHDDVAADLAAVIEASNSDSVIGIGVSRGGVYLGRLAARRPELLRKLVLVGTPVDGMRAGGISRLVNEFDAEFRARLTERNLVQAIRLFVASVISESGTAPLADGFVRSILALPHETIFNFFRPDETADLIPLLEKVTVPTLIMHGTEDRRVALASAQYLAEHIRNAKTYLFQGRGHLPIYTATGEFCDVLRSFVRTGRVDGAGWAAGRGPEGAA